MLAQGEQYNRCDHISRTKALDDPTCCLNHWLLARQKRRQHTSRRQETDNNIGEIEVQQNKKQLAGRPARGPAGPVGGPAGHVLSPQKKEACGAPSGGPGGTFFK